MSIANDLILKKYSEYLNSLAKSHSTELFSNGGLGHAATLMSILFENTENEVRLFCEGCKPDLMTQEPYWSAFKKFLNDRTKKIKVLIETDEYLQEKPLTLLKVEKGNRNDNTIEYKRISKVAKTELFAALQTDHCNFAVFDNNKFRLEFSPSEYKAIGSFNLPESCNKLSSLFDKAFESAENLG